MSEADMTLPVVVPVNVEENKDEKQYEFHCADKILAGVIFALAFLAADSFNMMVSPVYYGAGVTFYTLLYGICILVYAKALGGNVEKESWFWFAVMGICGVSYSLVYHYSLMQFQAVFLRLVTLYFTVSVFGTLITGKTGSFFVLDGINMLLLIPLANLKTQWYVLVSTGKRVSWILSLFKALLGLVLALPLLSVVISLLAGADDNFGSLLVEFILWMEDHIFLWAVNLIWAVPLGAYLYALIYGSAHKRGTDFFQPEAVVGFCRKCAVVPRASIYAVWIAICGLYILFIGLQGSYYLDALRGVLPEGFTYSEYARTGFFELVIISIINIGLILAVELICRRVEGAGGEWKRSRFLKWGTILISVLTLFLIATAMTKMLLYIQVYGLTPLRVIPSLFMVFLAIVFLLTMIAQFKRIQVVQISVYVFALGYAILSLSNMDGWIASYNLARYQNETLEDYPDTVLEQGSLASIPAMYQVWSTTEDPELKRELVETALYIEYWNDLALEDVPLKYANATKYMAARQLEEMKHLTPEALMPY